MPKSQTFFEGLLPKGFTRRTVAHFIHADENDYLTILTALGKECLGALRVADEADDRNGKGIRLAPAYDMVSTAIYEQSSKDMAFRVGGISDIAHINRDVFAKAVSEAGLGSKAAMSAFDHMADNFEQSLSDAAAILKEQGFHEAETIRTEILKCGGYRNLQ